MFKTTLWPGLAPALFILSTSCQSPDIPVTPGAADHSLDAYCAVDTAFRLCPFSRGTLPNWHLWRDFSDYLSPGEAEAFAELEQTLLQQIPGPQQPKVAAVAAFIAKHTTCRYDMGVPPIAETDQTGARAFTFLQSFPAVPNVPEPPNLQTLAPDAQKSAWIQAFEDAYDGRAFERQIRIVVEPDADKHYVLRSNIQKMFTEPVKIRQFWEAIESYRLNEAFEFLATACSQNDATCDDLRTYWMASERFRVSTAKTFDRSVDQIDLKFKSVALTGSSSYTVAEIALTNHSERTFSNILFVTDEVTPQFCRLQNVRTRRDDQPLTLAKGESRTAFCALNADTRPWVKLSVWMTDVVE